MPSFHLLSSAALLDAIAYWPNCAARAVVIFSSYQAPSAVCGGGHMNTFSSPALTTTTVFSNNMNNITVTATDSTSTPGLGNRSVDAYTAVVHGWRADEDYRRARPDLTGGFHCFINKYGFAMDGVLRYDVVLGNGTQVGGANNFGIVTRFTFQAYTIPKLSTTILQFNTSTVEAFVQAMVDFVGNDPSDLGAGAIEGTESPSRFANYTAIGPIVQVDNVTTPTVWHNQLDPAFQELCVQFAHKTMVPNTARIYAIYQASIEAVDQVTDVEGFESAFVLNTIPKSAAAVSKYNGVGNIWGLDDTHSSTTGPTRRTNVIDYHKINQELGLASEFLYMGDAAEFQRPFLGFPTENVQRLREIRAAYDSQGDFIHLNLGGFKLGAEAVDPPSE
ncbi:putative FAD-binding oxidoreductase [Mycena maculata]|uniref:FAD-binding oxidoreductase n=1 Tax=Mycena maculata TaxID=230809 RepID=A0AAD7IKU7_9AGAR|nr:putative FAD-binding oxidoreductase [Mycena maculata]